MRILFVQYAGDYREAYRRLQATGTETYYGHRYVLEELERLQTLGEVMVMCCQSPERYEERLPNGITLIGADAHPDRQANEVKRLVAAWDPTHLILMGPMPALIRWGISSGRRVICTMADSFGIHPLLRVLKYRRLAKVLNDRRVEWVANHGVNACRSLVGIGVDPQRSSPGTTHMHGDLRICRRANLRNRMSEPCYTSARSSQRRASATPSRPSPS